MKSPTTVIIDQLVQRVISDVKMITVFGINLSEMGMIIARVTVMNMFKCENGQSSQPNNLCDGRKGCVDWSLRRPSFEAEFM